MSPEIVSLGHVGIYVHDVQESLAFYRDLLGFTVTDADEPNQMYFLSTRPDYEHHQFLIASGRTVEKGARLVQQISFRCGSLEDVQAIYERMKRAKTPIDRIVSHGNAIGIYFYDPDRNRCEVYWPTGLQARQAFLIPVDLDKPADALKAEVRAHVDKYGECGFVDTSVARKN